MADKSCSISLVELLIRLRADDQVRAKAYSSALRDYEKQCKNSNIAKENLRRPVAPKLPCVFASHWLARRSPYYLSTREEWNESDGEHDPYYDGFDGYLDAPELGDRDGKNKVATEILELDRQGAAALLCEALAEGLPDDIREALSRPTNLDDDVKAIDQLLDRLRDCDIGVILTRGELEQLEKFLNQLSTPVRCESDDRTQSNHSFSDISKLEQVRDYNRLWYAELNRKINAAERHRLPYPNLLVSSSAATDVWHGGPSRSNPVAAELAEFERQGAAAQLYDVLGDKLDRIGFRPERPKTRPAGAIQASDSLPPLTKEAADVLRFLTKRAPVLATLDDIEAGAGSGISRATAQKARDDLIDAGYAHAPRGPKKGITATNIGLAAADKISTNLEQT